MTASSVEKSTGGREVMNERPGGRLEPAGFGGHTCAFCGSAIPLSEFTQLPITIATGGKLIRYWAHRGCFRGRLLERMRPTVETIPLATPEEIMPPKRK